MMGRGETSDKREGVYTGGHVLRELLDATPSRPALPLVSDRRISDLDIGGMLRRSRFLAPRVRLGRQGCLLPHRVVVLDWRRRGDEDVLGRDKEAEGGGERAKRGGSEDAAAVGRDVGDGGLVLV